MSYQSRRRAEKLKARRSLAKEILVERWTSMARAVTSITAARAGWTRPTEDHFAAGMLGLMKAITKFDGVRGAAFSTHVWNCVRHAVLDEIKGATWFPIHGSRRNSELPKCRVTSLDAMYLPSDAGACTDGDHPFRSSARSLSRETADALAEIDERAILMEHHESLWKAINQLPPLMREAIIEIELNGVTQMELAKKRGVSQPAISYTRDTALRLLREILEKENR